MHAVTVTSHECGRAYFPVWAKFYIALFVVFLPWKNPTTTKDVGEKLNLTFDDEKTVKQVEFTKKISSKY